MRPRDAAYGRFRHSPWNSLFSPHKGLTQSFMGLITGNAMLVKQTLNFSLPSGAWTLTHSQPELVYSFSLIAPPKIDGLQCMPDAKSTHWERPWCWERLRAEGGDRGWDVWIASPGHEFEQTLGDSGQRSLACCRPWHHKELDTT